MTRLGFYLSKKSINKAKVSKRTAISTSRLSELTLSSTTKIRAYELNLIAIAIDINSSELIESTCNHLTLQN